MKKDSVIVIALMVIAIATMVAGVVVLAIKQPETGTTLNISDMTQRQCDDIVSKPNAYTEKRDLVCEIQMVEEDDNIIILKEN